MLAELQKAIFTKLSTAVSLTGIPVFDYVPQNTAFPYIKVDNSTAIERSNHSKRGREITTTILVWTQYHGSKQCRELLEKVDKVLDRTSLTVTGFTHVLTYVEFCQVYTQPDGFTQQGVIRVRSIIEES